MSDVPPEAHPELPPEPPARVLPPDRAPAGPQSRFVDRLWSLRAVIAVALASVIIGGLGGAALANAGGRDDGRGGRGGFGGPGGPGRFQGQQPMQPPGTRGFQGGGGTHQYPMPRYHGPGNQQGNPPGLVPPGGSPTPSPPKANPKG